MKKVIAFLLAMLLYAGSITAGAAEELPVFAAQIRADFAEPEMRYRPYARWWLAEGSHTDETLRESIRELYDAGYGGVEFVTLDESRYLDNATYAWGSPEWIHDTHVIIEECAKLGMSVSMTSGTHWATANLMSISPDEEAASQELGYVTVTLEQTEDGTPPEYEGELPKCKLPRNTNEQHLVRVLAAKVMERGTGKLAKGTVKPTILDFASIEDLTALVQETDEGSYTLSYTAPDAGEYEIFAFYRYGTGEAYAPAVSNSYTINYLSKAGAEALIDYWDNHVLTPEVQELIERIDECDLYMDSLELSVHGSNTTGQLWCEDMPEQFEARSSYGLDILLPFLIKTGGRSVLPIPIIMSQITN